MKETIQQYSQYLLASLLLHGILLTFLLLQGEKRMAAEKAAIKSYKAVEAVILDEAKVTEEVNRLQFQEQQQKNAQELQQKEFTQKLEQVKRERELEQAKLEKLKKDMAQAKLEEQKEKKQLAEIRQEKEKEKKNLAALDDQLQAERDRFKEMQLAREKEEKKRLELVKQQQEAKHKAEEAKRLAAARVAKEAREAAARQSQVALESQRVVNAWRDKIQANKRGAFGMSTDLYCKLGITVLPDGSVRVKLVESSGNAIYDDLSIKAVYKSQPFQLPEDPLVREQVKSFELGVRNDEGAG